MICQNCNAKPASFHSVFALNGEKTEIHLCYECKNNLSLQNLSPFGDIFEMFLNPDSAFQHGAQQPAAAKTKVRSVKQIGLLDHLGKNLNDLARQGKIDPVIGREKEIDQVIEILNRRNKNNPVLIGEPGVGKTAIAEGLALRIVLKDAPSKLQDKEVYVLDVASLVSGTGVRGQFEQKMQKLIEELENRSEVILFIDEIHLLVGAGSAEGSMDAGNILKPTLARGQIQIVGATTLKEYRIIEKDSALERRFQPVKVDEPSPEETYLILKGLQHKYEAFHQVKYADASLKACVELSKRYIQDRFLPDKAIDLLDMSGSKANLRLSSGKLGELQTKLSEILRQKEEATKSERYELAGTLKKEEQKLRDEISLCADAAAPAVEASDIEAIVENITGIPVKTLESGERKKMICLQTDLEKKIVGQRNAVEKVAKAIKRSRAGLRPVNRPLASFLFFGPTGVGKTELSKALAEELFGSKDAMIRLDMSEYMEAHTVSKLIGSPPGYVGYEDAGQLTEKMRRNPYAIILADEIEKAHPEVLNIFLQILEDGSLTDSRGKKADFKNAIVIMTSNAGSGVKTTAPLGFTADDNHVDSDIQCLRPHFKPEFLNRFDAVVKFSPLAESEMRQIADLMLNGLILKLQKQQIRLLVTDSAKSRIAALCGQSDFGARPMRRAVQEHFEDPIADLIFAAGDVNSILADEADERIIIRQAN